MSRPLSFAASTAAPRSTPEIERPEPLPMPSSPRRGDERDGAVRLAGGERLGGLADRGVDRPALLVEPIQFGRDRLGLGRVLGGEQADAEVRLADPAAGVDARAEREAQIAAFGGAAQAGRVGQGGEADILPARHHLEALGHERPVQAAQLGDVGDRAQSDEIEQLDKFRLLAVGEKAAAAQRPQQGGAEQERHADRGEMPLSRALLALVEPVGVDDREAVGERGRAFVVVDDDHVDPGRLRRRERLERLGAAIDGDDQRRAGLGDPHQRLARRAIALHQPVGDIGLRLEPERAQQADEQGGGGRAVDVVIAEDRHLFPALDGVGEPFGRLVHVAEDGRIGHEAAQRRRPVALEILAPDAAGEEELVDEIVGLKAGIAGIGRAAAPAPRLPEDRARHAADMGGSHQHRPSLGQRRALVNPRPQFRCGKGAK
jgi:hypothetical protein